MRTLKFMGVLAAIALTSSLLISCAADKGPADTAIKAADQAIASVKDDASKYVPTELQAIQASLDSAKAQFAQGNYKAALATAGDLAAKASDLTSLAATKKDELTQSWATLSAGLPKMVESVKARVDRLAAAKALPTGVNAQQFEQVKADVSTMVQTWTEATAAQSQGMLFDAVSKATAVKDKATQVMKLLGMKLPAA